MLYYFISLFFIPPLVALGLTWTALRPASRLWPLSSPEISLLVLVLAGTMAAYILDRFGRAGPPPEDTYNRPGFWRAQLHRLAPAFRRLGLILLGLTTLPAIWLNKPLVWLYLGLTGALSALYLFPLLPGRRRLIEIWPVKPFLLATVWILPTTILPLALVRLNQFPVGMIAQRFLLILANVIVFDGRDARGDSLSGKKNLFSIFGEKRARILVGLLLLAGAFIDPGTVRFTNHLFPEYLAFGSLFLVQCFQKPTVDRFPAWFFLLADLILLLPLVRRLWWG